MINKYLSHIFTIAKRDIVFTLVVLLILGLMEGIGLMMIIPLLSIIGISEQEIIDNQITLQLTKFAEASGVPLNLVSLLIAFMLLICVREYFIRLQTLQSNHIQQKIINQFRYMLFNALVHSNWLFFTREKSSDITQALTQDINRIGLMAMLTIRIISTMVIASAYIVSSILVSFEMTLITMASALTLLWVSRSKFKTADHLGETFTQHNNQMYSLIGESLAGIKTAKCYGAEHRQVKSFEQNLKKLYDVQNQTCKSRANAKISFGIGTAFILAGFLFIGVEFMQLSGTSIILLVFLFSRLSPKIAVLQQDFLRLSNTLPALRSYDRLLSSAKAHSEQQYCATPLSVPVDCIELQNVYFSYERSLSQTDIASTTDTLTDIKLSMSIGSAIAIVGPSGTGKSTVADILMGLINPTSGSVCLDSNALNQQQLIQWRKQVAYVSQDPHFLHDSIRNNLLWCKPDASEENLLAALKRASAFDFVMALPNGLDTIIGNRGNCLSGGERQRVAIARALLFEPTLLILDEATSGLDESTQKQIVDQLMLLKGKVTLVMITHRLTVLQAFDKIYIMEEGTIKDVGNWSQMTNYGSHYV